MYDWKPIIDWKLLKGSHGFPGADGGTCINEAAVVAAGFEYRRVDSADDCPPCFSRVLSAYLIGLNDRMPDAERQKLMRFVLRLSGSADTSEVEQQRVEFIVVQTVRRILPVVLRARGLEERALACEAAVTLDATIKAARAAAAADAAAAAAYAADAYAAAAYAAYAAYASAAYAADAAASADAAAYAARAAAAAYASVYADAAASAAIWSIAIQIAEEAFAIGNQAAEADAALVVRRMEAAKEADHA